MAIQTVASLICRDLNYIYRGNQQSNHILLQTHTRLQDMVFVCCGYRYCDTQPSTPTHTNEVVGVSNKQAHNKERIISSASLQFFYNLLFATEARQWHKWDLLVSESQCQIRDPKILQWHGRNYNKEWRFSRSLRKKATTRNSKTIWSTPRRVIRNGSRIWLSQWKLVLKNSCPYQQQLDGNSSQATLHLSWLAGRWGARIVDSASSRWLPRLHTPHYIYKDLIQTCIAVNLTMVVLRYHLEDAEDPCAVTMCLVPSHVTCTPQDRLRT
jgi:hypothetical protein